MGWRRTNEEGLKGAFDPGVRDQELDADGVAADVLFADADAITGMASLRSAPACSAGAIEDPEAGVRGHTPQPLPGRHVLGRPHGGAGSPWCPSPTTFPGGLRDRVGGVSARHPGS